MKKKCKNKYEMGGTLNDTNAQQKGQMIGSGIGSLLNFAIPGLGAVASPLLGQLGSQIGAKQDMTKALQDHFNSLSQSSNPYGNYALGGEIKGGYENLLQLSGNTHAQGGIQVNAQGIPTETGVAEVEAGETALRLGDKTFIFSKHLVI